MAVNPRSRRLTPLVTATSTPAVAITVPAGEWWLIKTGIVWNGNLSSIIAIVELSVDGGSVWVPIFRNIVQLTSAVDMVGSADLALEPGDKLRVKTGDVAATFVFFGSRLSSST